MSRSAGALLLFELVSGLAITFGPFNPTIEWGLLLHTIVGVATLAPLAWYIVRHWQDYSDQALSDVVVLGHVGAGALVLCLLSGAIVTAQALFGIRTSPWLRYTHLISPLLLLAAVVPHVFISWQRRRSKDWRAD